MKKSETNVKLFIPHIVILLLLMAGIVISLVSLSNIGKQTEALYNESYIVTNAADVVDTALETMQKSVFRAVSNDSQEITKQEIENAKDCVSMIQEQTSTIRQNFTGNMEVVSRLEKDLSELEAEQEHVLDLVSQQKNAEATEYMENNNVPVIKEAQKELELLIQSANVKGNETITSLQKTQRNTIILLVSLGMISVLFSIGVVIYIRRLKK